MCPCNQRRRCTTLCVAMLKGTMLSGDLTASGIIRVTLDNNEVQSRDDRGGRY